MRDQSSLVSRESALRPPSKKMTATTTSTNALGFFEYVALKGIEGKEFTMSYKQQREFFGYVPFGKKRITVRGSKVSVVWKVAYGQDWESLTFSWSQADHQWCDSFGSLAGLVTFHS